MLVCVILYSVVKLSSHKLNYLIIVGAALLYISVYMYIFTADQVIIQTVICNVSQLSLSYVGQTINMHHRCIYSFDSGYPLLDIHYVLL